MKRRDFLKYGTTGVAFITLGGMKIPFLKVADASAFTSGKAWKFGIISDTQWTVTDDGRNPNTSAADIIQQVNKQFISRQVSLVVAVGDTVDTGGKSNIYVRALYAQELYNAGIGFYPLRGNHEVVEGIGLDGNSPDLTSGFELEHAFPQLGSDTAGKTFKVGNGLNNHTASDVTTALIAPQTDLANNPPKAARGLPFAAGWNFSAPVDVNTANYSASYSFDYNNVRFILLDQFDATGNYYNSTVPAQQTWIDEQLSDYRRPQHAFVFIHKNILGGNHKDNMFGAQVVSTDPGDGSGVDTGTLSDANLTALTTKQEAEDAFITSLADNDVHFCISGHDHHHYHSIVTSPLNSDKSIHQLITQSDSSKFYTPSAPFSANDLPVTQDLYRVGYYIFTLEGPRVTIDYYASQAVSTGSTISTTPTLTFTKRSSFGFSLNGKEFQVAQGGAYTTVEDGFEGTKARILGGANGSTGTTNTGRALTKVVNTGWTAGTSDILAGNILSLWGMADVGSQYTDAYTLSMSYDNKSERHMERENGNFGIAARDKNGNWVKAVSLNSGGTGCFVAGPWDSSYGLGTYGVDYDTKTAWAVINYTGDFAVARHL